ncbi:MAG: 2-C-methyl-D-erythritol 2,4-cyclodiphosphate synthase [Candidatus Mycalebacterium zealandia]|nr:MAG: 2-C-methyl-D-erythritol 2,4-cyclodiphosphate synthase [Candidatus Mycalebacterium zealandia]
MTIRTGIGFDAHRFAEDRELFLGCVKIPFDRGLEGHSDADVLAHAICDSMLGAAGLGDIGKHFPDTDPTYKGASGASLLEQTREKIVRAGFEVSNVDAVVICEKPLITPYAEEMSGKIAEAIGIAPGAVNIKATTTEKMGWTGAGEGIAAKAICLITEKP